MAKKTCAEAANLYEDVLRCPGVKRLPGTRAYGWLIRLSHRRRAQLRSKTILSSRIHTP